MKKIIATMLLGVTLLTPLTAKAQARKVSLPAPYDYLYVENTGNIQIKYGGTLEFLSGSILKLQNQAYGPLWNGNTSAPTKDAVYDKIESILLSGGGYTDAEAIAAVQGSITGTPSGVKYLKDNWTWDYLIAPAWGQITGVLSSQTDLQSALNGKAPSLGSDDNYVTDAEKTKIGFLSTLSSDVQTQINGKAPSLGSDDNYVTDAEKTVIGNTSNTNSGDDATNSQYSGLATSKQDTITGLTASGTELNILDGATLSTAELNYVTGVTGSIQTQLNAKLDDSQATAFGLSLLDDVDATAGRLTLGLGSLATQNGTLPVKASGAEVDTGTDDAKFLTPKAIEDSNYIKAAYADALVADSIANGVIAIAPSQNAVFDALALKAPSLGGDDNYVTDAEKTMLSNISVTQPVDLDTIESDTATNNAKVTNATHTGEVTGSTALTIANGLAATKIGDGSVSTAEYQYINSVTSNVQTQIDGKAPSLGSDDNYVTDTEKTKIGFLSTLSSDVQTQINGKAPSLGADDNYVTDDEKNQLPFISTVTSNVQDQIDGKAPSLGADDNYVTDAEKTLVAALPQTSVSGNAGTVTVADAATDTTTWLLLGTSQTGSLAPATDAGVTYDASTNALTATTFIGALTGNASTASSTPLLTGSRTINGTVFDNSGNITITAAGSTLSDDVTNSTFRQGSARSVVGVIGNATADVADIQGATDQVLRVNGAGTALGFGAIDLSKSAAATGVLQAGSFPILTGAVTTSGGSLATTLASGIDATKIGGGGVTSGEFDYLASVTSDIQSQIDGKLSTSTSSTQIGYFGDIKLKDDTNPSHYLSITDADDLSADHTLSVSTSNADRTLTISGDATVNGTNTGDQPDVTAISDTMAHFDTALNDGNFVFQGGNGGTPSAIVLTNASGTAASLTAGNATKWTTGRTIALTGDVTYTSSSLDGSGNVTGTATLANIPAISGANLTGTAASFTAGDVTGLDVTAAKILSVLKTMSFTAADDTGVYTFPTGTKTLLATDGSAANLTSFPTFNQNTTGSAASLSISGQTGLLTFTGLTSTNRIKTVRDAADTILELGGSYTPTGTWTNMPLTTPAISGLATGSGVASAATASTLMSRDSSANAFANNMVQGFATTATAAGTTTMTITDKAIQVWTGSSTQTVKLPTTSIVAGATYQIINLSTGAVTVQSSGANTILVLASSTTGYFTAVVATPTVAADWNAEYFADIITSGKSLSVSKTMTFTAADDTGSYTFPTGTKTLLATDGSAASLTSFPTFNQNTTGSSASLSISGQTGLMTVTGLTSTNRIKTVRDAADTILELGGSYTPTGTWTNMILTSPTVSTVEVGAAQTDTTITRSSAGIIAVEGVTVPLNSTTNIHTAQQIELGAASDTTITRSGAGAIQVEGVQVLLSGAALGTPASGVITVCTVAGDPYSGTWNGNLATPSKDDVYDKIESLSAGSGLTHAQVMARASFAGAF